MTVSPTVEERLAAIRKRDADWVKAEFDGTHEHPETQCTADIDRHFLLGRRPEHGLVIGEVPTLKPPPADLELLEDIEGDARPPRLRR